MTSTTAGAGPPRPCMTRMTSRHSSTQHRPVTLALFCVLAVCAEGCGTVSPRYKSPERPGQTQVRDEDESRFAGRIREEETREDDKKVDLAKVQADLAASTDTLDPAVRTPAGINRDRVLLDVVGYLGTPYRYGGMSREGIDCSGLTAEVYGSAVNLKLPRSTREQYDAGAEVERDSLQFGDLVFFNTTGRSPSHVGIYIEDDLFAHASVSYGVTISSLGSTYYRKRYVGAKRVVPDRAEKRGPD